MDLRNFVPEDLEGVIELWNVCELTRPWNDPALDIERALACPCSTLIVGQAEGSIVGSVMAGYDGHRGWIYYLAVHPAQQRRGFGRQLMREAEDWLAAAGAPKMQLMVRAGNESAVAFYHALKLEVQPVLTLGRRLDGAGG